MNFLFRSFITCIIIFCSFLITVHIDEHVDEKHEGYSICNIDCNEGDHHNYNHQCEFCVHNGSTITRTNTSSKISYKNYSYLIPKFKYQKKTTLHSNLLSRPPPKLL